MPTETGLIYRWLYATLTGDTTLAALVPGGWFRTRAPAKTSGVFGILRFQGGSDANVAGGGRMALEAVYAVYAVGENAQTLEQASTRIDVLLSQKAANVTGGRILSCVRESPLELPILDNGIARETSGGAYRITAQTT